MNNLNSILVEGNLTKDPEIIKDVCCLISIASNRYYKHNNEYENEVSYFDVKCFGKLVNVCKEYLKKGRGIRIIGRLKQERWNNKEDQKKSRVVIIADHIEFSPKKKENGKENI